MRIGIANDLSIAREALRRAVSTGGGRHAVAWTARDGGEAVKLTASDRPDLILMDLIMPGVDGVEATRRIMAESPCPILVVTSTVSGNIGMVYEAMGHGALDAVETPQFGPCGELTGVSALLEKIDRLGRIGVTRDMPRSEDGSSIFVAPDPARNYSRLVLLGASTGGPKVLAQILSELPRDLPAAVVVAQHVDASFVCGLAKWLAAHAVLPVELAVAGICPEPGRVYVGASQQDLVIRSNRTLGYRPHGTGLFQPSIDALFESAARHWPTAGAAALLTGMLSDGAAGLLALRRAGWLTIAQDRETSVVWSMPKAAIDQGAARHVLPAARIAPAVVEFLRHAGAPGATAKSARSP